jgi:hypothetical protein
MYLVSVRALKGSTDDVVLGSEAPYARAWNGTDVLVASAPRLYPWLVWTTLLPWLASVVGFRAALKGSRMAC